MEENKTSKEQLMREEPHSVKFSMNAKGLVSAEVKCYGNTPEVALEKATKLLTNVEEIIKKKNSL